MGAVACDGTNQVSPDVEDDVPSPLIVGSLHRGFGGGPARILYGALVLGAVLLSGCSSASSSAPYRVHGNSVAIVYVNFVRNITVPIGGSIQFRLAAEAGHRPDGSPVLWLAPTPKDRNVLLRTAVSQCRSRTTCVDFRAVHAGTTVIAAAAPSGILCGQGGASGCTGVAANTFSIPVRVVVNGLAAVTAAGGMA